MIFLLGAEALLRAVNRARLDGSITVLHFGQNGVCFNQLANVCMLMILSCSLKRKHTLSKSF